MMMNQSTKSSAKSAGSGNRKAGSPGGKASSTSVAVPNEPKKQKLPLWPEWNENDINAEKWEVGAKLKDSKTKPTSAQPISHGFEDPDPKFDWPYSIQTRIETFKRPTELFEKVPIIVDADNGLENFDLIIPNEHLHNSETMRWIISQIHTLWDICRKEIKQTSLMPGSPMQEPESGVSRSVLGRLWRPWEHIYAVNKVTKGPFIPAYNPHGKYAVRLYFMGAWRKIIIDDLIPVDDKGTILLPQTTISGELWPMLLTKALLKIVSLDFNSAESATEFNDANVISYFTGWLPEPLPLRFGHMNEVWKFLKETLPKFQWAEEKAKILADEEQAIAIDQSEPKEDASVEKDMSTKADQKSHKKTMKEPKVTSGKDTKLEKHKKEVKDGKKAKSTLDEQIQDESFSPDFPEMVAFASFTDLPLTKLSASTEVADRRERLRKYNLNHDFSNPVWITCTRDKPLNPPPPPEIIPVWKTIRQKKKYVIPSDEPVYNQPPKPDQWVELKSPYIGVKSQLTTPVLPTNRANSRFGKIRSRPQTSFEEGIQELDERLLMANLEKSESPTDLQKIKIDINESKNEADTTAELAKPTKAGAPSNKPPVPLIKQPSDLSKSTSSNKKDADKSVDGTENTKVGSSIASKDTRVVGGSSVSTIKVEEEQQKQASMRMTNGGQHELHSVLSNHRLATSSMGNHGLANDTINLEQPDLVKTADVKNKLWMDFDDFFICFKSIIVYHKPSSYKCNVKYPDSKQATPHQKEKRKETNVSQPMSGLIDEKTPRLLFVDSLTPVEFIVSFSCMSRWYEQKLEMSEKPSKTSKKAESLVAEHDSFSMVETKDLTPIQPGSLMAEPYSWKSLVTGQPVLRIHTTAIRSSYLSLAPGRHVLKFMISAPIGYHIHIVSNTQFAFSDEEDIISKIKDVGESCRFIDQANHIMKSLNDAIKSFTDIDRQKESFDLLYASICPLTDEYLDDANNQKGLLSKKNLYETFQNSLYEMLRKALGEMADQDMAFAWKTFLFDTSNNDIFGFRERRSDNNASDASSTNRGSAKKLEKKKSEVVNPKEASKAAEKQSTPAGATPAANDKEYQMSEERQEHWKNHVPSANEHFAAVKIQSAWRGHYVRKMFNSRNPGCEKNHSVAENLKRSWAIVEDKLQDNALYLFRTMFKLNPAIMHYYPFYKDEWNRISYSEYTGSYPDQPSHSWLILFRDVFYANEQVLLLPKVYTNLNNCLLKVVNNDSYKEIPKVFNKVSPNTYAKNKRGYTILAESRITDQPIKGGQWRLRLIGSSPSLLVPRHNKTDIVSSFDIRESRDYYMPNEHKVIMRYKVTVTDDHLTTLQLTTSKSDVYIKFSIYDNGDEVLSVTGKGTAVIPAFIFMRDRTTGNEQDLSAISRPGSKTFSSGRASKIVESKPGESSKGKDNKSTKRVSSANSLDQKAVHSRSSSRLSGGGEIEDEESNKTHKYIIEAVVLKNSWPLTPSQWAFVNNLKESEAAELRVFSKDRAGSPTKESKATNPESKAAALKAAKAKAQKKGTPGPTTSVLSRPTSSAFDISKPHWILRWASDAANTDNIDIRKDTDRVEEIKSLKRAWENHENGRAAKAMVARSKFLKENLIRIDGNPVTDDEIEKLIDDESQATQQPTAPGSLVSSSNAQAGGKQAPDTSRSTKTKQSDEAANKQGKNKQKKEKNDVKIAPELLQATEQPNESVVVVDEIFSNEPPPPAKPKIVLPPLDVAPFVRKNEGGYYLLKDETFEREQAKLRKMEFDNFMAFKEQISKFRDEERKYRLNEKLRQIEECENLQAKLEASRRDIFEPREAFRQIFLEAERKRLEEVANQEAQLVAQLNKGDAKKKGSAGKGKKKK